MIRVLFCIPYARLEERIQSLLNSYSFEDTVQADFLLDDDFTLFNRRFDDFMKHQNMVRYEAVVARGLTYQALKNKNAIDIPVIELKTTSSDIVNAINKCKQLYDPQKIAIVGPHSMSYIAQIIATLTDVPIKTYYLDSFDRIEALIDEAVRWGCESVIGGTTTYNYASKHQINTVMLENSDEDLLDAIKQAESSIMLQRSSKAQTRFLNIAVNSSRGGIILVDSKRKIRLANSFALDTLGKDTLSILGRDVTDIFPELADPVKHVFNNRIAAENELFRKKNKDYSAGIQPVIINKSLQSVVITFDDITQIQNYEKSIRSKLHEHGLVAHYHFEDILYSSVEMRNLINKARKYSRLSSSVLILGETGVGKELFAQGIHNYSPRRDAPFVAVNCAALPEQLLDSELFGYSPGAFTGANKSGKQGLFELAHRGTIFLDEISEMPLSLQGKLLRVLEEKEIRRIGDDKVIPVDVRIISASNKDLNDLRRRHLFRDDLYYRINVLELRIPPLRERPDDIRVLLSHFLDAKNGSREEAIPVLTDEAWHYLETQVWEGNIRELRNLSERIIALQKAEPVAVGDLQDLSPSETVPEKIISEKDRIIIALQKEKNREEAARSLGMSRSSLWRKMRELGIEKYSSEYQG